MLSTAAQLEYRRSRGNVNAIPVGRDKGERRCKLQRQFLRGILQ